VETNPLSRLPLRAALSILLAGSVLAGCAPTGRSLDLLDAAPDVLREATVAGQPREWVLEQAGLPWRLADVVRTALPAGPPSRTVFAVDVPRDSRLFFACGIGPEYHSAPGVQFTVKVRGQDREDVLWTRLLNPLSEPADRRWVPAEVDLSPHAGRGVEIILETTGYEELGDPERAFWGSPTLATPRGDRAPLVVVYLVDSLRADHTTPYGYERDTTPELMEFTRDAVVFDWAIASAGWTKPSVASIFTSQIPARHGVMQIPDPLGKDNVTLAEMLQARGYATGAVIANAAVYAPGSGYDQGFDLFAGVHGPQGRRSKVVDAADVVDTALRFIDTRRGLPAFLYVHAMDPHIPYIPPAPFDRMFEPPPAPGRSAADPRKDYESPEDLARVIAQYDGCIAYGDREFGRFLSELEARGLYDRALIVFVADHGEEFLDHERWTHAKSVFDELVRVPLVVKHPGQRDAGQRVSTQVQLVDLLPSILENEQLPVPSPPAIAGQPLSASIEPGAGERVAILQSGHRGYTAYGVRTQGEKYVRRLSPEDEELYFQLSDDPGEQESRLDQAHGRVRALKAEMESAMSSNPYDFVLRFEGEGVYEMTLRTGGWIERLEAPGLGGEEYAVVEDEGRRVSLRLRPSPGEPRQVTFGLKPRGAPVWLDGTRDGRPLPPSAVRLSGGGVSPEALPCRLPDIERPDLGTKAERSLEDVFSPPPPGRGVSAWLTLAPSSEVLSFDDETRAQLEALGYVGN
jgi:arylsulfatase A-like enzyme